METSSAASTSGSAGPNPVPPRAWPLAVALVVWVLGSFVPLMFGFLFMPMFALVPGLPLGSFLVAVPAVFMFALVGLVQQSVLGHSPGQVSASKAEGWARRTVLGGVLGSVSYMALLELLGLVYGDSPLLRGSGIFRPGGTEVQVAIMLLGLVLMGVVLSAWQWRPWAGPAQRGRTAGWLRGAGWTLSGALGWGAAGAVLWYVYENRIGNVPFHGEDMFLVLGVTMTALFWAAVAVALSSALALKSPLISIPLSSLACAMLIYLTLTSPVATAYGSWNQPLFTEREIHPQKTLTGDAGAHYLAVMDFSDDGSLLAALVHDSFVQPGWDWLNKATSSSGVPRPADPKVVLWRVPDWKRVGVIPAGQISASLEQISLGSGAGTQLVAEVSPEYDRVYVRRATDRSLVTTLDFRNPPGPLPEGFLYDAGNLYSDTKHFVSVRTPDGKDYRLSPQPVMSWVPWSPEDYAISPDGRYIVSGYDQECKIWVWALPGSSTRASTGQGKSPATPQPQPKPQAATGAPQVLPPFKTLDVKGAYGGDVAPEGYPGEGLFSPNGQYVVTNVHQGDVNTSLTYHAALVVWRTSDWQRVLTQTLELGFPTLAFSPDSKTLAVGSEGGTIALYATADWTAFRTLKVEPKRVRVAFLPDGSALASASGDSETIQFWRTADWSELRAQQIKGLCAYCYFDFSPDGRLFTAKLSDGIVESEINIWRVEDGSLERTLTLPEGVLGSTPSFSRDGSVIKAYATMGTPSVDERWKQYMWRVEDGRPVDEDPDKGTLVGAGGAIYRLGDPEPAYVLGRTVWSDPQDTGMFGDFSPDGSTVVGTCGERLLCLWAIPNHAN